jgi:hypothetical protein
MGMNRHDAEWFLRSVNGQFKGFETRHPQSIIPPLWGLNPHTLTASDSYNYNRAIECAIVSIPIDGIQRLIESFRRKSHPTDDDLAMLHAKIELYETDPYFKQLYDTMNTYLQLKMG